MSHRMSSILYHIVPHGGTYEAPAPLTIQASAGTSPECRVQHSQSGVGHRCGGRRRVDQTFDRPKLARLAKKETKRNLFDSERLMRLSDILGKQYVGSGQKLYHFRGQAWMLPPDRIFSPQFPSLCAWGICGEKMLPPKPASGRRVAAKVVNILTTTDSAVRPRCILVERRQCEAISAAAPAWGRRSRGCILVERRRCEAMGARGLLVHAAAA